MNRGDEVLIKITNEQTITAAGLVDYSQKHHPVSDVFDKKDQFRNRFIGTLGEIVFADVYGLPRPTRAFGAIDGQDYGVDFVMGNHTVNVKTMKRKNANFNGDWVLNIPARDVKREDIETDFYYLLVLIGHDVDGFHTIKDYRFYDDWQMALIGFCNREDIVSGKIGTLYKSGTIRTKDNGETFVFHDDTYEIKFSELMKINKHKIKKGP